MLQIIDRNQINTYIYFNDRALLFPLTPKEFFFEL